MCPPSTLCSPQLQSTCHYIVNHYVKILHVHLGVANNMHPLSWGGTNGKDPKNVTQFKSRVSCVHVQAVVRLSMIPDNVILNAWRPPRTFIFGRGSLDSAWDLNLGYNKQGQVLAGINSEPAKWNYEEREPERQTFEVKYSHCFFHIGVAP